MSWNRTPFASSQRLRTEYQPAGARYVRTRRSQRAPGASARFTPFDESTNRIVPRSNRSFMTDAPVTSDLTCPFGLSADESGEERLLCVASRANARKWIHAVTIRGRRWCPGLQSPRVAEVRLENEGQRVATRHREEALHRRRIRRHCRSLPPRRRATDRPDPRSTIAVTAAESAAITRLKRVWPVPILRVA